MVPSVIVMMEELPLTPNGKVDRKALPAPEVGGGEEGAVGPRTPVEEMLAEVWGQVLKVERVGVNDNFFELGGHSLLATQVVSRVRTGMGVEVALRKLFEQPTVEGLARVVEEARRKGEGLEVPVLRRQARGERAPLSFAQQRLWFLDKLEPGVPFYNVAVAVGLRGALDVKVLEGVLREMVARHEALRTTLHEAEEGAEQRVWPRGGEAEGGGRLRAEGRAAKAAGGEAGAAGGAEPFQLHRAADEGGAGEAGDRGTCC